MANTGNTEKIDFHLDNVHVEGSGSSFVALLTKPRGQQGLSIAIGGLDQRC